MHSHTCLHASVLLPSRIPVGTLSHSSCRDVLILAGSQEGSYVEEGQSLELRPLAPAVPAWQNASQAGWMRNDEECGNLGGRTPPSIPSLGLVPDPSPVLSENSCERHESN